MSTPLPNPDFAGSLENPLLEGIHDINFDDESLLETSDLLGPVAGGGSTGAPPAGRVPVPLPHGFGDGTPVGSGGVGGGASDLPGTGDVWVGSEAGSPIGSPGDDIPVGSGGVGGGAEPVPQNIYGLGNDVYTFDAGMTIVLNVVDNPPASDTVLTLTTAEQVNPLLELLQAHYHSYWLSEVFLGPSLSATLPVFNTTLSDMAWMS